jgi:predicted ATP-grasp superfamily ATP-dependent carboligase
MQNHKIDLEDCGCEWCVAMSRAIEYHANFLMCNTNVDIETLVDSAEQIRAILEGREQTQ